MKRIDLPAAAALLLGVKSADLICHKSPDGDTLGSAYALSAALRQKGIRTNVWCADKIIERFAYMELERDESLEKGEIAVAVDVADSSLIGSLQERFEHIELCIDHHRSNKGFADELLLDDTKAACGEIILELLDEMKCEITPFMASCLYAAIATDTGCFKYSNTTADSHRAAARLTELGAEVAHLNKWHFETKSRARVELERRAMKGLEYFLDGRCAVIVLTLETIENTGVDVADIDGVTALPRQIEGVEAGLTLRETGANRWKISLRTDKIVDASEVCREFGGGGHARAAGCEIDGSLDEVKKRMVDAIAGVLEDAG